MRALEAGADTLLMPADPDAALKAVVAAVESGRLARRRIQESVAKILAAKEKVGLDRKRSVDVEALGDVIDSPEATEKAEQVAARAVTLVRNGRNLVPLAAPQRACFVVMPENRSATEGQAFTEELHSHVAKAPVAVLDPAMTRDALEESIKKLSGCDTYVVAAFSSVAAYRGAIGLSGELPQILQSLIASRKPVLLIALGNPYLLRSFPDVAAYLATFSTAPPSETAAVQALFGEINITGHLPVSIPPLASYGEGLQLRALRAPLASQTQ